MEHDERLSLIDRHLDLYYKNVLKCKSLSELAQFLYAEIGEDISYSTFYKEVCEENSLWLSNKKSYKFN
jgi:hypothetical protein